MSSRRHYSQNAAIRQAMRSRVQVGDRWPRQARRTHFSTHNLREPFAPPEDWHEPAEDESGYRIVVQPPGYGYRHVVTPDQIRRRLSQVPQRFLRSLEVVQLSRMTRKKQSFPCYGMQWGATLYLYPLEDSLEEYFYTPPRPEVVNEAKMYGGLWDMPCPNSWRLTWSQESIEDFYLNNILIHELGHLVDEKNTSYADREKYAEWFAIEFGYRSTGGSKARRRGRISKRHHKC